MASTKIKPKQIDFSATLDVDQVSAPSSPSSGFSRIWTETDGRWYTKKSDGTIYELTTVRTPKFYVGDGSTVVTTGGKVATQLTLPYGGKLIAWYLSSPGETTSATIDIWYHSSATPTNSDSMPGGSGTKPSLSSASYASSTSFTSWSATTVSAGGKIRIEVESNTASKYLELILLIL